MTTLPGNLTNPTAGPILCRCAPADTVFASWKTHNPETPS